MSDPRSELWGGLRAALDAARRAPAIERTERRGAPPLSFAQEGIWLHERLHPRGGAFNTTLALRLEGPLELAALQTALETVVERHEVLRTAIVAADGVAHQAISPLVPVDIARADLSHLSAAERSAEVERLVLRANGVPFDLGEPPLWRLRLLVLAARSHLLLWSVHHLVWDQSSYSVWLADLADLYGKAASGCPVERPELPIQYADFAAWDRRRAESGELQQQVEHWREALDGCSWRLELPRDRRRPAEPSFTGRSRWLRLDDSVTDGLKELGRSAGATLYTTVLAGYAALLARYGNDSQVVVGSPFSKRYRRELRPLIGPLVNLLLLRLDVSGDPTVQELLDRVRGVVGEAYANQDAPYEQVTVTMRPDGERSGGPRVQTMLTFYRMPAAVTAAAGLELRPLELEDGKARMDLELYVWETPEGLHGRFIFDADLFLDATMDRICGHFLNLLGGMVADPSRHISELPLLSEDESRQLIEWGGGSKPWPSGGDIADLFEAQVRRSPEATALVTEGGEMTYRELEARAEWLAGHLQGRGIGEGSVVAVHLGRGENLVVALLAILRLGGTYVPLDLADPPERTRLLLDDSGSEFLLTTAGRRLELGPPPIDTMVLEELPATPVRRRRANRARGQIAYVTYTSGSTGLPKGIVVPHEAVIDTVMDVDYLVLGPGDRVAQAANVTFDVATAEIWGALLNGATLVVLPTDTILAPSALAAAIEMQRIDTLFLTTSLFHRVAAELPETFQQLRDLLVGGEALDPGWVRRVQAQGPPRRLLNVYGPTETTAYSTWYPVDAERLPGSRVPIGRPIGRTRAYVLDTAMRPVPIGVPGELYLGGPSLARGYLGRPELTAERFVPDPFCGEEDARLYRTGDRVRYLADGNLDFLERIDEQIKIRGNRIEPGEIEAALALHQDVRECAVVVGTVPDRDGSPPERRLAAYVVPTQERLPDVAALRSFLQRRLPSYMVPAVFVPIERLPLTPSGKVDRLSLSRRSPRVPQPSEGYAAPHNEIERKLAEIWKRVLWLEEDVGIHDDFFDLGGHSLLAFFLIAEVEKEFEVELQISALSQLTTVSELAGRLEPMVAELSESLARELTQPRPEDSVRPHRLAPEIHHRLLSYTAGWRGQRVSEDGGLMVGLNLGGHRPPLFWCLQGSDELQQLARYLGEGQPVYGMRSGHLAMQFTAENIRALAARYVGEILAAEQTGPYLVGGNCQGAYVAWAIAEELRRRGRSVPLLALQLFDFRHALPYGGPVALFFGADAGERFRASGLREPDWPALYPAGFTIDPISGTNRWHFVEPHIQDFAPKLALRLEQALVAPAPVAAAEGLEVAERSRGVVVLGLPPARVSVVADLIGSLGPDAPGIDTEESRRISAIHESFLAALGRAWHDTHPLPEEVFSGETAIAARARLREVFDRLATRSRWVLDGSRLGRLLPLWDGLLPAAVDVHFLHVLCGPSAAAAELVEHEGLQVEEGLLSWLLHALDSESATRGRSRSWVRLETLGPPVPPGFAAAIAAAVGPLEASEERVAAVLSGLRDRRSPEVPTDLGPALEVLRFQPWADVAERALLGFSQGREIESRVALDALRFGLDEGARRVELERVQGENVRLREKTHAVWQQSLRVQEDNERLHRELESVARDHERVRRSLERELQELQQRGSWRQPAPLRWLAAVLRGTQR